MDSADGIEEVVANSGTIADAVRTVRDSTDRIEYARDGLQVSNTVE